MNLLNAAVGALTGGLAGSPLTALAGPLATPLLQSGSGSNPSAVASRDSAMPGLSDLSSAINQLGQFASSQTSAASTDSSAEQELTLPPLPPTPAPQAAPAIPRDDHGQSNVVISDGDADSTLIH